METYKYVMIGNSYGAIGCIESIRTIDKVNRALIISDEPYEAYGRPLITYWLADEWPEDRMNYRPKDWNEKNLVDVMLGVKVTGLDLPNKQVICDNGERIAYENLLISTGGVPISPPMKGNDAKGVFNLTTFQHAKDVKAHLNETGTKDVVLVGGGLIGLSAVKGLVPLKVNLTIVELSDRVLGLAMDQQGGDFIARGLEKIGCDFRTKTTVEEIYKDDRGYVSGVRLASGDEIPAGLVIVAIGVRPNLDLLGDTMIKIDPAKEPTDARKKTTEGIKVNRGILVDENNETSYPGVYAAGDCCEAFDIPNNSNNVIAILPIAFAHGRVAGMKMSGGPLVPYSGGMGLNSLPMFHFPLMTMGLTKPEPGSEGFDIFVDEGEDYYRKLIFRGHHLVGVILIGKVDFGGVLTELIKSELPAIGKSELLMTGDFQRFVAGQKHSLVRTGHRYAPPPVGKKAVFEGGAAVRLN